MDANQWNKKSTNSMQFELMVKELEKMPTIARGVPLGGGNRSRVERVWTDLSLKLNALGPPCRNGSQWRKVWVDFRLRTKRKIAESKDNISELEHIVHRIISNTPVADIECVVPDMKEESTVPLLDIVKEEYSDTSNSNQNDEEFSLGSSVQASKPQRIHTLSSTNAPPKSQKTRQTYKRHRPTMNMILRDKEELKRNSAESNQNQEGVGLKSPSPKLRRPAPLSSISSPTIRPAEQKRQSFKRSRHTIKGRILQEQLKLQRCTAKSCQRQAKAMEQLVDAFNTHNQLLQQLIIQFSK